MIPVTVSSKPVPASEDQLTGTEIIPIQVEHSRGKGLAPNPTLRSDHFANGPSCLAVSNCPARFYQGKESPLL